MTDKKIIIDGVNVAGCYYLKYDKIGCDIDECYCVGNDCYYKQLRRKEQECEELKERLKCMCFDSKSNNNRCISYNRIAEDYERDLQRLTKITQECEELKKYKDAVNKLAGLQIILTNKDKMPELYKNAKDLKIDRYKQALEKIEIIAKRGLTPICYKSNCNSCQCYEGDDSKISLETLINNYFTEDGFNDDNGDFYEELEGLVENERTRCNKAKPLSDEILSIINKLK